MNEIENGIRQAAVKRIADVFRIAPESVRPDLQFFVDLKCSVVSDFKRNEYDELLEDVHYVANSAIEKELASEALIIHTVDEFCNYMVRCHKFKPAAVEYVLRIEKSTNENVMKPETKR